MRILKVLNRFLFQITSVIPLLWILFLNLFFFATRLKLGHFPQPSIDDPKDVGLDVLFIPTALLFWASFYSSFAWFVHHIVEYYFKTVELKYVVLFVIGIVLCMCQIAFDPGYALEWFLD